MLFYPPKPKEQPAAADYSGGAAVTGPIADPQTSKLQEVIALLKTADSVMWVSEGAWSMHHLLQELLKYTGPAKVTLSSYAFSEHPARILADLMGKGIITELHCLIDSRIDVRSASAFNMIRSMSTRCKLINTHAKVTILEGQHQSLVVVGSANYTTNKRYEAGLILKQANIIAFNKKWIEDEFRAT